MAHWKSDRLSQQLELGKKEATGSKEQHLNCWEQPRNTTGTLLHLRRCTCGSYIRMYSTDAKYVDTAPSRTYVYLGRSLPTYGCACENIWGTYGQMDGANTVIRTGVTPETYGWNTGKPTGVRTTVKLKPFHGMYRTFVLIDSVVIMFKI